MQMGLTPLHYAAGHSKSDSTKLMVKAAAESINTQDEDGCTPLHYAAFAGERATTGILINAGADVSITDSNGNTAEQDAQAKGKTDVVARIQKGIDLEDEGDEEPPKAAADETPAEGQ